MQGPFTTRRGGLLYLLVWLMLGLILSVLVIGSTGTGWINGLLFAIPVTMVYAFATGFPLSTCAAPIRSPKRARPRS
jgi:two-component system sensor histidine kinase AlgZ